VRRARRIRAPGPEAFEDENGEGSPDQREAEEVRRRQRLAEHGHRNRELERGGHVLEEAERRIGQALRRRGEQQQRDCRDRAAEDEEQVGAKGDVEAALAVAGEPANPGECGGR
jgi:hypothetical protein